MFPELYQLLFSCLRLISHRRVINYAYFHNIDCRCIKQRSQDFNEFGISVKAPYHYTTLATQDDFDIF